MIFLFVPFHDKDEAKRLGARWHAERKQWFVPDGRDPAPFKRWMEKRPAVAVVGSKRGGLYVDLVPSSAWFSNLRSELKPEEWKAVQKRTFTEAGHLCEVCGGHGPEHPVECHERWYFDEDVGVQFLQRTVALCPACHESTHMGLADIRGRLKEAFAHLVLVNDWTTEEGWAHVMSAKNDWERRNELSWRLDATWLLDFVPLSAETTKRILDLEAGLIDRDVEGKIARNIGGE